MTEEFDHLEARLDEVEFELAKAYMFAAALANLLCKQGVLNADILQSQKERLEDPDMITNADLQFLTPAARWKFLDQMHIIREMLALDPKPDEMGYTPDIQAVVVT